MSEVTALSIHAVLLSVKLSAFLSLKFVLILYAVCLIWSERLLRKPCRLITSRLDLVRIGVVVLARVNEVAEPILSNIRALHSIRLT